VSIRLAVGCHLPLHKVGRIVLAPVLAVWLDGKPRRLDDRLN
jgi:hypothetical protein